LANVVMVKKINEKWRVCIKFTCLKDSYPLPKIDRIIDDTSKYVVLSFLDAFLGYHQINMYPPDTKKTTFITEKRTYCYQVMHFGLKNAGTTHQRIVNNVLLPRTACI